MIKIETPKKPSESMIQFELYRKLVDCGIDVIPELKVKTEKTCIFDLAIMFENEIIIVVETKSWNEGFISTRTKQKNKYKSVLKEIPLLYCCDMKSIEPTVEKIIKYFKYKNLSFGYPRFFENFSPIK
jgi:hypothetical protein